MLAMSEYAKKMQAAIKLMQEAAEIAAEHGHDDLDLETFDLAEEAKLLLDREKVPEASP